MVKKLLTESKVLLALALLVPTFLTSCDDLFKKSDGEKGYEGPDQLALFPFQGTNDIGVEAKSGSVEVQYISEDGLATADISVNVSVLGASTLSPGITATAEPGKHYTLPATSATIKSGENTSDLNIDFVVTTIDEEGISVDESEIDSSRVFGSYEDVSATGGDGSGAIFNVQVNPYGKIVEVKFDSVSLDSSWKDGRYLAVEATGGSGSGVQFDVTIPRFGEIQSINPNTVYDSLRSPGQYPNVPGEGGNGTEAFFNVSIDDTAGVTVEILFGGQRYLEDDSLTISSSNIGGTGADLIIKVNSVSPFTNPILEPNQDHSKYLKGDSLIIAAADIGGIGKDLAFKIDSVSQITPPVVSLDINEVDEARLVSGGEGYAEDNELIISGNEIGSPGRDLKIKIVELTGSFANEGKPGVILILGLNQGNNSIQVAEKLKEAIIHIDR